MNENQICEQYNINSHEFADYLKRKGLPVASCKYQDVGEIDPESHELLPPPSTDANQKHLRELVLEWKARIFKKNKSDECEDKEKSDNEE